MDIISKNSVSIAGEFAVLSQLALRGFDANMTLGHTKNVDILVSDPLTNDMFKLEVKTSFGDKPANVKLFGYTLRWMMSEKHENIIDPNLFYCFVNIEKQTNIARFFLVPSDVVAKYVKEQHQFWLNSKSKDKIMRTEAMPMRQFRIGINDDKYAIKTPLAKDYENKWNFKRTK